jgi:hypothetical protein
MKTFLLMTALSGLMFAGNVTLTGWISDTACGAGNASDDKGRRECAKRCIENGEAPVFVADNDQKVYKLKNAAKAKELLEKKVKLVGAVEGDTITVSSLEYTK